MTGHVGVERLVAWAPDGVPEVAAGDDLAAIVLAALGGGADLADGDVVSVTSKVVSKAEGRARDGDREAAVDEESVRLVARRGATRIVRHRLGLTMAAAGVDASNVAAGTIVLLPLDPDASARALRRELRERAGVNVGVIVTDTAGRAWREGQTDLAIGAAGLVVAEDFAGRTDPYGNPLQVTLPAVADELAGAAELVQGKLSGRPVAVLRGRGDLVLPPGQDGPGAASLVRPDGGDLFGWGAREAVVRALAGDPADLAPFGSPAPTDDLEAALDRLPDRGDRTAVAAVCFAHGWRVEDWEQARGGR
ncbi:MAG TPA: coenzyme F420-0:L-glutamate ligase [Nocardioides sp.]